MNTLDSWILPQFKLIPAQTDEEYIDFYCGPGGLSQGLKDFFRPANAVDINADACATFRLNHRQTRVRQMKVADYLQTCVPKDFDGVVGGVAGGPPCQGFSILNKKARAEQEAQSERVQQVEVFVRAVALLKPRWVVLENVASIPKALKDWVARELTRLGLKVIAKTIHCSDYGSVQVRRRWICIGHRARHVFPQARPVIRQAADILDPHPGRSEIEARPGTLAAIRHLPAGVWTNLPGQSFKVYYVVEPHKLLPAVVNPVKLRYIRPDRSGYLTKAELERAQGFPAGYRIVGTLSSWGQQLANAVPVELGNAIGAALAAVPS